MKTQNNTKIPDFHMSVIFCEDVRQEQSGQLTIIGAYQDLVMVKSLPHQFHKLTALVKVRMPVSNLPNSLAFRIENHKNEVLAEASIPKDFKSKAPTNSDADASMAAIIALNNLKVEFPTVLTVVALHDDSQFRSRELLGITDNKAAATIIA